MKFCKKKIKLKNFPKKKAIRPDYRQKFNNFSNLKYC